MLEYIDPVTAYAGGRVSHTAAPQLIAAEPNGNGAAHSHDVQFYVDDEFLCAAVADYMLPALAAGEPVLIIATLPHQEGILRRLGEAGVDPASRLLTLMDAHDVLGRFMAGTSVDEGRFRETATEALRLSGNGRGVPSRAFGELVDLLCRQGNPEAALIIESIWCQLAEARGFSLLCGYSMDSFGALDAAGPFTEVCRLHGHILPTERYLRLDDDGRLREIALLQQRAEALAGEVEYRRRLERMLREALAERDLWLERERAARMEAEAANRTKGEFLAVMSHELRTPLNAIAGYAELLEVGVHGGLTDKQHEAIGRIRRSQRHLLTLIDEVLSYARTESGQVRYQLAPVPIEVMVRAAEEEVQLQMRQKRLSYSRQPCDRSPTAYADEEKVLQILLNLLTNATKYTEEGGRVWVECEASDGRVSVHVHDTGIGIPAEKLDGIFEPFVQVDSHLTRQNGGIGLGLAISRTLAQGMGGDLLVRSLPGRGSTFTLMLPAA